MIRVNLLGLPKPKRRARMAVPAITMGGMAPLIVVVAVVLAVAGFQYYQYDSLTRESLQLGSEIDNLRKEKARLEKVRADYETNLKRKELLQARIDIIEGLKAKQSGPVTLLSLLANTVSSTEALWLTAFEQVGEKITIEGIAMNVKALADFMTRLKGTNAFAEMDLKETFQDTNVKELRNFTFTLNGQLAPPQRTT